MPLSLEQERAQIQADEKRLSDRKRKLADKEKAELLKLVDQSGLSKLEPARLAALMERIKTLGVEGVEKRLAA